jgi:hypothetical protein
MLHTMFNLDHAMADWRCQMLDAGIKNPVPLDELEIHLREEIERQMMSGLDEQKAFEMSVRQFGQPKRLKKEFKKTEKTFMRKIIIILAGIFGVMFGPGLILPALAKHNNLGIWNFDIVWPIVLGTLITLIGISVAVVGFKKRKA